MTDVGTLADSDDPMKFDVPQLNNVYESAPYLHDGKAATLEEIWTKFNDHDQHGVANDMTKDQLNDLVEYLKSIGDAKYYLEEAERYKASITKKEKEMKKIIPFIGLFLLLPCLPDWPQNREKEDATMPEYGNWKTFTTKDGLPANKIFCVRADGDRVWIGTSHGLVLL